MYAVTAATGQLGRLVIDDLLSKIPAERIAAAVRDPAKAADLSSRGVVVREADYDRPDTLATAFRGVERLLLISSSAVGRRVDQHRAVIRAAENAGVSFVAYTSILHADRSTIDLAGEHRETEAALAASPLRSAVLRNGWYSENYLGRLAAARKGGVLFGAGGSGRVASAARADYAAAAVAVLTGASEDGRIHELAGDHAWTLAELAEEEARRSGHAMTYENLMEAAFREALVAAGLPTYLASIVSNADAMAADGALFDEGGALSKLIGRPTTPMSATVATGLDL